MLEMFNEINGIALRVLLNDEKITGNFDIKVGAILKTHPVGNLKHKPILVCPQQNLNRSITKI